MVLHLASRPFDMRTSIAYIVGIDPKNRDRDISHITGFGYYSHLTSDSSENPLFQILPDCRYVVHISSMPMLCYITQSWTTNTPRRFETTRLQHLTG